MSFMSEVKKKNKISIAYLIPLAIFLGLAAFFMIGLGKDPRVLPTAYQDKPIPAFTVTDLFDSKTKFSPDMMKGKVWMLNVWSTWCMPCKQEHPFLVGLKRAGVETPIVGLVYRDSTSAARAMLAQSGNPYDLAVYEEGTKTSIDLGVTGVPETFIVDKNGIIRMKYSYPILDDAWNEQIRPLIEKLEAEPYPAEAAK